MFDYDRIREFSDKWNLFSEDQLDLIFRAGDIIKSNDEYRALCEKLAFLISEKAGISEVRPADDKSLFSEFCILFPTLYLMRESTADMEKRGIEYGIIQKSIQPLSLYMEQNAALKGQRGFSAYYYWLPLFARGRLLRFSGFEFERSSYNDRPAIGVHIPPDTDISEKKSVAAFRDALEFYGKHYPEDNMSGLVCKSWLLNPEIEVLLGKKTTISRFGDLFERSFISNNDGGVYRFIFGRGTPDHPEKFCENTSLQKAVKKYILDGHNLSSYCGFISLKRLDELTNIYMKNE